MRCARHGRSRLSATELRSAKCRWSWSASATPARTDALVRGAAPEGWIGERVFDRAVREVEQIRACADAVLARYDDAPVRWFLLTLADRATRECLKAERFYELVA